ncbi:MAG: hypothetical protein HY391_03780 [Deltaproteobacteria bacterium]|nr:hypothetical protein [Deltaproteobacteria bacterium]
MRSMQKRSEKGQAVVETLLVLPFIMALIVWLFQYFQAIHSAVIHQTKARYELWQTIDHWRDLRAGENFGLGKDNDSIHRNLYQNRKTSLSVTVTPAAPAATDTAVPDERVRKTVATFGKSNGREIILDTTVGICRDAACR